MYTRWVLIWKRLSNRPVDLVAFGICILSLILILVGPWVTPKNPFLSDIRNRLKPPSIEFPLGTDSLGRDILSRIIYGFRPSMTVGLVAVILATVVALIFGLIAGWYGGYISLVIMRLTDLLLAFPWFLLILTIVAVLGPSLPNVFLALGLGLVPSYIRLVRGLVLSVREREFVQAAQALGETGTSIMFRYILPNSYSPILVQVTLAIPRTIMAGAALSFLGMGVQPPTPEWGVMLSDAREYITTAPHMMLFPALTLMIVTLSFNLFGDALRDILDPRMEYIVR